MSTPCCFIVDHAIGVVTRQVHAIDLGAEPVREAINLVRELHRTLRLDRLRMLVVEPLEEGDPVER